MPKDQRFATRADASTRARREEALRFIQQFQDPWLYQNPMVQQLKGREQGEMYGRLGNIGTVLMDLYNQGGVSKGPEYFQDPDVLRQRAQMMFRKNREHPLLTAALDLRPALEEARARRNPPPPPPVEPPPKSWNPYADWDIDMPWTSVGEALEQLSRGERPDPWVAQPPGYKRTPTR